MNMRTCKTLNNQIFVLFVYLSKILNSLKLERSRNNRTYVLSFSRIMEAWCTPCWTITPLFLIKTSKILIKRSRNDWMNILSFLKYRRLSVHFVESCVCLLSLNNLNGVETIEWTFFCFSNNEGLTYALLHHYSPSTQI